MRVRFYRVNEEANSFDVLGDVFEVTRADFERMRAECECAEDDTQIVADLKDRNGDTLDTALLTRQMHLRAASALKAR